MQNTGKRCVILLVFIILRWSFNYESNVFRYNKILIDCVFGNSKFVVPSTLTIDLGFASVNSQCLGDNKLAIPSYPVNKYILLYLTLYIIYKIKVMFFYKIGTPGKHYCCSPVDKCYVPCLSGNVSVFAFRDYNLDRKLKIQIWSLWKHKIKTHK